MTTNLGIAGLASAYVFVAALVSGVIFRSGWSGPVKAGSIIAGTLFYLVSCLSVPQLLGWPANADPPDEFRLVAAHIQQPDKATEDAGAIYLWITDARDLAYSPAPRAFRLPYSQSIHELALNARAKLNKGVAQMGEFRKDSGRQTRIPGEPKRAGQGLIMVQFYDVPDPLYPEK